MRQQAVIPVTQSRGFKHKFHHLPGDTTFKIISRFPAIRLSDRGVRRMGDLRSINTPDADTRLAVSTIGNINVDRVSVYNPQNAKSLPVIPFEIGALNLTRCGVLRRKNNVQTAGTIQGHKGDEKYQPQRPGEPVSAWPAPYEVLKLDRCPTSSHGEFPIRQSTWHERFSHAGTEAPIRAG